MKPEIYKTEQFVTDVADYIEEAARRALGRRGAFRFALSGGNTPRAVYAELARRAGALPWERTLITFGDERCVPPDHAQSNYRMAKESLFDPAGVPASSVLRMRGEIGPEEAAAEYEARLLQLSAEAGEGRFVHDLILLGLGDDGHTASLFPDTAALQERTRSVVANFVPKLNATRITFTFPLINAAREVCFLVGDEGKKGVADEVLTGKGNHPASRVCPDSGTISWFLGYR